ncbi:hypothetical protein MC7420_8326 [Coleofasciculus chthonoplastes PCC 7420]|uniref:Uncharacterized protein n=1 Tax=Coleofasciculus chthonoplastes PCC 7420 TaxID=118168 RepID=B4W0N5_9CYAN|nr:WYL domain-containing protein [Coleofasciculus chthonoplastes]EDX72234.1 hypothetical protein MC7420_8326 [Coleofasciculus chthonoplastes PCC 7420]
MSRKGQSITLSLSTRDKTELEAIALELGILWGERANISKLVEAIARRQLLVLPNQDWTDSRIQALDRTIGALTDIGEMEQARIVAELLLERSELSIPLRRKIEGFVDNLPPPWRIEIDRYLRRQHPFELSYQDAPGRLWQFTIRYGRINLHEKRQYLDCWCEETEGNLDIPELQHNWCLRLDRIQDAAITPIKGQWRHNLDQIEVEMHLFKGLAFAYQARREDQENDWLPDQPRVRRVVRSVSSTFWFLREVKQYGKDCQIIVPDSVRSRYIDELIATCNQYNLTVSIPDQ